MSLPKMSGSFRCVKDPVLRFSQGGMPICSFTAVADKKKKNEATGEWEDDKVIFVKITAFKGLAEHIAESVQKGTNVVVSEAEASMSEWTTEQGEKRSTLELIVNDLGVGLFWDTVTVHKVERSGGQASTPATDPWSTPPTQSDPWGGAPAGQPTDPPF
jgi:single-strand DNA-binding protein